MLGLRVSRAVLDLHDPAAGELALGLQEDLAGLLQELEGVRPEVQPQDVALPRQQVVADVQPPIVSRWQRTMRSAMRAAMLGGLVAAVLDRVQRRAADLQPLLVLPSYHSVTFA